MNQFYRYSTFEEGDHDTSPGLIRLYDLKTGFLLREALCLLEEKMNFISDPAKKVTGYDHFNAENGSCSVRIYTYRDYLTEKAVCDLFESVENLQKENGI